MSPARRGPRPAIEARGLTKVYGEGETAVHALDGVDLALRHGEMVAIMGPSGSGKSTLLHLLGALDTPSDGIVKVGARRFDNLTDAELTVLRRDSIGFVFQFFNLLPALTAEENVLLPALIAGTATERVRRRALTLLDRVGLADRAKHLPSELSGGEQQRVSIARALLMKPKLVLADEPTGNLDTKSSAEVLKLLRGLNRSEKQTILLVTHDPATAAMARRIVFLRDGIVAGEVRGGSAKRIGDAVARLDGR